MSDSKEPMANRLLPILISIILSVPEHPFLDLKVKFIIILFIALFMIRHQFVVWFDSFLKNNYTRILWFGFVYECALGICTIILAIYSVDHILEGHLLHGLVIIMAALYFQFFFNAIMYSISKSVNSCHA